MRVARVTLSPLATRSPVHPHHLTPTATTGSPPVLQRPTNLPLFEKSTPAPTSVHRQETNVHSDARPPCRVPLLTPHGPVAFRHSGWEAARNRTLHALQATCQTENRIKRFFACGLDTWVFRHRTEPDQYKLVGGYCHDRFCVPCSVAKAHLIKDNLLPHVSDKTIRHMVLTIRGTAHDLRWQLDNLLRCFALLRRTALWHSYVHGGAAFLELKYNPAIKNWHPHIHILYEGRYYPHHTLSAQWEHITKGSFVVWIEPVPDGSTLKSYVVKYAGKGVSHFINHDPDLLEEAVVALKGRRTCMTFGRWRGFRLLDPHCTKDWVPVQSFGSLLRLAGLGDPRAKRIVSIIYGDPSPELIDTPLSPDT